MGSASRYAAVTLTAIVPNNCQSNSEPSQPIGLRITTWRRVAHESRFDTIIEEDNGTHVTVHRAAGFNDLREKMKILLYILKHSVLIMFYGEVQSFLVPQEPRAGIWRWSLVRRGDETRTRTL